VAGRLGSVGIDVEAAQAGLAGGVDLRQRAGVVDELCPGGPAGVLPGKRAWYFSRLTITPPYSRLYSADTLGHPNVTIKPFQAPRHGRGGPGYARETPEQSHYTHPYKQRQAE
jgi:hypothetical protein